MPAEPAVVSVELSLRGHPLDALRRYLADDLVTLDRERAMQVEVDSGEHLRLGTIRLGLGGGIAGVVRNRRGRPVPFAWVAAHRQKSDGTWREVANDPAGRGGRYRVRGLPEGVYRLEVRRRVLQPDGSRLSADQLRIDSDQVVDGVDLVVGGG